MKFIYTIFMFLCVTIFYAQEQYLEKLPDSPDPGKCYAKCIVPDQFEIKTVRVVEVPAHNVLEVVPAEYKAVKDEVIVKPASKKYKYVPAVFKTVYDTFWIEEPFKKQYPKMATFTDAYKSVEVKSESGKWVAGENPDCPSINPDDCRIFYYKQDPSVIREIPVKKLVSDATSTTKQKGGKYKLVKREVMETPAQTIAIDIPEVKEFVERRVLVKDETTKAIKVPAVYTTVEKRVLVKKGGMEAWREVPCTLPKDAIILPIHYELGSAKLTAKSKRIIDKHILSRMKQHPDAIVEVGSHTDSRGGHEFNKSLSNKRSKSVVSYLNQKGIETSRLIAVGYGESKLLNDCKDGVSCSETQHAKNRRTEFKFY